MKNYDDSILLINKDTDIMSQFSVILGEHGYNLRVALDRETAIEIIKNQKIDLIVIDFTFEEIVPKSLFYEIVQIKPEIPRIALINQNLINESDIIKIHPYVFDIVIKPICDINDFRMRIRRGIENTKLLKENREYQRLMVEKTFRIGMLEILSSILSQVNIDIDQLLADIYLWKEECLITFKDMPEIQKKFSTKFNDFKEKILHIEEKIQLNEVLLSEHSSGEGIFIDTILKDILETLKDTFEFNNIKVSVNIEKIYPIKIDSVKIVQTFFHLIENSISFLKNTISNKKEIKIIGKNFFADNQETFTQIIISDNAELVENNEIDNIFDESFDSGTKNIRFGLHNIKKYLESINGSIQIVSPVDNKNKKGTKITICLPVNTK